MLSSNQHSNNTRVLVIGLRMEQARSLREQFKDIFDIDFNPNATRHIKSLTNMDVYEKIIVCTKFTDHKTHVKCKKHRGYTMTSGGFSSVKVLLGAMV